MTPGRNDPCPCGSGKKYKRCCGSSALLNKKSDTDGSIDLAIAAFQQGKFHSSMSLAAKLLQSAPDDPELLQVYALAQFRLGHVESATKHMEQALRLSPRNAQIHSNLALILQAHGQLDAAERHCRRALDLDPRLADAYNNLGNVLKDKGELKTAAENYGEAIRLEPGHPLFHYNYGTLLPLLGDPQAAELTLMRALELDPSFAPAYNNLGTLYFLQGRLDEARHYLQRAVSSRPPDAQAFANYGLVLQGQGALDEAHALALKVLEKLPDLRHALHMAIDVFGNTCDFARREEAQRRWAEYAATGAIEPSTFTAALLDCNYTDISSQEELYKWHIQWASTVEHQTRDSNVHVPSPSGDMAKIRIGYVSPDFRGHATAYFVQPIIANHNRDAFEVYCYHNYGKDDSMTEQIRRQADKFVHIRHLSDEALANLIEADGIDILVDLAGHTSGSRLGTFARRPAPLQITYLGYPNTTGLYSIDYIVTDPHVAAGDEKFYTEKPLVLPECLLMFPESAARGSTCAPPCERNGYITFGSLNNLKKLTSHTVRLWANILQRVEGSRLLIGYVGAEAKVTQANLRAEFARYGIDAGRLTFVGRQPRETFLRLYESVDVLLDTYPYTGTTTTCEALWAGVPVVTLVGPTQRQRVSYSILKNTGLDDMVAFSEDQYTATAVKLALDPSILRQLRTEIPAKLRRCVVGQPERFTRQLEQALLHLWQERFVRVG